MSTELKMLLYSIVLGLIQIVAAAQLATRERGIKWNMGARDAKVPELKGVAGRFERASKNFLETFPFFAAAALMVHVTNQSTWISALGAQMYFFARIVYVPLYAAGIPMIRSLVWLVSLVGLLMVLVPLF